jgi:hypothetical protein
MPPPCPRDPKQCALPSRAPSRAKAAIQNTTEATIRAPPQSQAAGGGMFNRNHHVDRTPHHRNGGPTPSSLTSSAYKSNARSNVSSDYELATPYNNAAYPIGASINNNDIVTSTTQLQKSMTSEFSARKSSPPTATSHPSAYMTSSHYQQHNNFGHQQGAFSQINDENNPNDMMNEFNIEQQRKQQQPPFDSFTLDSLNSSEASSLSIHEGGSGLMQPHERWGNIEILLKDQDGGGVDKQQQKSRAASPLSTGRSAIDDDHSSITTSLTPILSAINYGNPSQIDQLQDMPLATSSSAAAPPVVSYEQNISTALNVRNNPSPSTEAGPLHSRLRSLEIQHENLLSANKALASQLKSDRERIDSLESSEEEARQEAALWEARWRDDFGNHTGSGGEVSFSLLEQLRGALLQKSKEEYGVLKQKLVALTSKFDEAAESYGLLMAENEAIREEVRQGGATNGSHTNAQWERRALDSEKDLMKRKGELHQLTKEKRTLEEQLNQLLETSERSRKEFESIQMKLEQQLKDEREVHQAKMKQIASETAQMIEAQTSSKEAELDATKQENMVLKEENKAASAENEKLAERVVDLERKINASLSDASDLRKALLDAETAIPKLETERNDLREKMSKLQNDYSSYLNKVEALSEENEKLKIRVPSLEEQAITAQNENKALRRENDAMKSKMSGLEKENIQLNSGNLAMKERLNKEVEMMKTLQHADRSISKENSVLRSSIAGLEHKLMTVEACLSDERKKVASAERARDQAEEKADQFDSQVKTLEYDLSTAHQFNEKKREEHLQLQDNIKELKKNISSLREEISAAAIARSQLELELKQREDECYSLRSQLDPMSKEKYRLELDNASLIEEVESLKKSIASNDSLGMTDLDNEGPDSLVKRLEEKNRSLTDYIATLQKDLATIQLAQAEAEPNQNESPVFEEDRLDVRTPLFPAAIFEQLKHARAAAKKTATYLKDQREKNTIDESLTQTPTVVPDDQCTQAITNTPHQQSPEQYSSLSGNTVVSPERTQNALRRSVSKDALKYEADILMQLEERHSAEKTILKSKFQGRLRRMKKEWDIERKAILGLVANKSSAEIDTCGRPTLTINTPASNMQQMHVDVHRPSAAGDDMQSIVSSYDETEAFVMNILNGIEV